MGGNSSKAVLDVATGSIAFAAATKGAGLFAGAGKVQLILIGGGIFLGICGAAYIGYKVFKYFKGNQIDVHKALLENFSEDQIRVIANNPPAWQRIQVSAAEIRDVRNITLDLLKEKIGKYSCPITHEVSRNPVQAPCCGSFFEKNSILPVLEVSRKCPICRQRMTNQQLLTNYEREDAIQMLRMQIRKAYQGLVEDHVKREWKTVIQQGFGEGYVEQHLENDR